MLAKSLKSCLTLWTLWTVTHQASLSMGILQARILESVAIPSSRGSSQPRDRTLTSCDSYIAVRFFTTGPTRVKLEFPLPSLTYGVIHKWTTHTKHSNCTRLPRFSQTHLHLAGHHKVSQPWPQGHDNPTGCHFLGMQP